MGHAEGCVWVVHIYTSNTEADVWERENKLYAGTTIQNPMQCIVVHYFCKYYIFSVNTVIAIMILSGMHSWQTFFSFLMGSSYRIMQLHIQATNQL